MTSTSMAAYVASHGSAWTAIVSIAFQCKPDDVDREAELLARATASTKATVKRKFAAIHHKREQGWNEETIAKFGQGQTLSSYAASRKDKRAEVDVILRYRVPSSLGDAWSELIRNKLAPAARLKTSEDLIEFLHSCFVDLSPREIQNLAGTRE